MWKQDGNEDFVKAVGNYYFHISLALGAVDGLKEIRESTA
jgi:hypothetical protein